MDCTFQMMKKLFFPLALLIIFVYVSVVSNYVYADEATSATSATVAAQTNYALSYPGVLPDNPLYFLKAARDRIVSFLINDPVKRAEFDLLTSDKRIYSAQILADKKKGDLSISTLSKSNNYLDESITAANDAKKQGKDSDTVLNTLKDAIKKHQEVLLMIKKSLGSAFSKQVQQEGMRLDNFGKSVDQLKPGN